MKANSRFKKSVNEWGRVDEWIEPGDTISASDIGASKEEWQALIDSGAVVKDYPEGLSPQMAPAEYYRSNPDDRPEVDVDETTPVPEAKPNLDTALSSGKSLPTGSGGSEENK